MNESRTTRRTPRFHFGRALLGALIAVTCWVVAETSRADGPPPIHASAASTKPLAVGDGLPALPVETLDGEAVDLAGLVRESGALLVFYRGGW